MKRENLTFITHSLSIKALEYEYLIRASRSNTGTMSCASQDQLKFWLSIQQRSKSCQHIYLSLAHPNPVEGVLYVHCDLCTRFPSLHKHTHTQIRVRKRYRSRSRILCHSGTSRIARTKRNAFETNEITDRCCFVGRTRTICAANTKETCTYRTKITHEM